MLLVMPLLTVPFITIFLWSFGMVGGSSGNTKAVEKDGMNTRLPDADNLNDAAYDKLAFYKKAEKDSLERLRRMKDDPYYRDTVTEGIVYNSGTSTGINLPGGTGNYALNNGAYTGYGYNDPNEKRVNDKLAQLNAALTTNINTPDEMQGMNRFSNPNGGVTTADIDRLEKMMSAMQGSTIEGDPEMQQINSVLGQILDIQHPERVNERLQQNSAKNKGQVYAVTTVRNADPVSFLTSKDGTDTAKEKGDGFFSFDEQIISNTQNAIAAVMHETQTLLNGSVVKLRLMNDVYVSGQLIPKDNFVFGLAQIQGERLTITINGLRYANGLFPVKLSVFDVDGLDGIHIPGAISRDVAKESGDRAIQSLGMTALDPSMTAQAVGVGVEAVKSLMSKKVKLVKVTVKAGYKVLLRDDNQRN
jgi:conjugative transposon TraM protein